MIKTKLITIIVVILVAVIVLLVETLAKISKNK